jgi:carbon-monoxide dehydrogenase small subunit
MAAMGMLNENPEPTEEEARRAIAGNLCRCTGYTRVAQAVLIAAEKIKQSQGRAK